MFELGCWNPECQARIVLSLPKFKKDFERYPKYLAATTSEPTLKKFLSNTEKKIAIRRDGDAIRRLIKQPDGKWTQGPELDATFPLELVKAVEKLIKIAGWSLDTESFHCFFETDRPLTQILRIFCQQHSQTPSIEK